MKWTWKNWISDLNGNSTDVVITGHPFKTPESLIGIGLLAGGMVLTLYGTWKSGALDHEKADFEALKRLSLIKS